MRIADTKISIKLPIFVIAAVVVTGVVLATSMLTKASGGFQLMAEQKLVALVEARKSELSNYLELVAGDLKIQSGSPMVLQALVDFRSAWGIVKGDPKATLQKAYIQDNPNPAGEKHKLDMALNGTMYDRIHGDYHGYFRDLLETRQYYDIFLLDPQGNVIYSVYKELDYATNMNNGEYAKTDLGKLFRKIAENPEAKTPTFVDFAAYAPSAGAAASFIGMSIVDEGGHFSGVLVFQMPIGEINRVMQAAEGMGESGETYIVGKDHLMRSDSRFSKESTILKTKIDTETVKLGLSGKQGVTEINDYRGVPVISAYVPMNFYGTQWTIIAEVDQAEALSTAHSIRNISIGILIAIVVVGAGVAFWFAGTITKPITKIVDAMNVLAEGNSKVEVPYAGRGDEVGSMAAAVQVFKENAIERERLEEEERQRIKAREIRQQKIEKLTTDFDAAVTAMLGKVRGSVESMHGAADSLSANAEQTQQQSATVSAATEQATANVETVSAASTELTASIDEISRQITESSHILENAVSQADSANQTISSLAEAARRIGEVVSLINDIAEQTNLLALNATIESARAGEAGKGFAVVASEVKNLAGQTGRATEEIRHQIKQVQDETDAAVQAIRSVSEVIGRVNELSTAIAGAVEEQNASTAEIARNVEEAARGTQEVSENIQGVAHAATETGKMAQNVFSSANDLLNESDELREQVETFLHNVHEIQRQEA